MRAESPPRKISTLIEVKYPRLQDLAHVSLAELSDLASYIYVSWEQYAGGTPGTVAAVGVPGDEKSDRDDILGWLLAKLEKIENFIKTQKLGGAPAVILPKRSRKGLDGFRVGVGPDPRVGFNPGAKKAIPKCPWCSTAEDGHKYHSWADCPLGGKKHPADTTAAYCQPVNECTAKELHKLALCQVFQAAADGGAAVFAAAVEQYGAPAVVRAGATSGGVDISAYGFTTASSEVVGCGVPPFGMRPSSLVHYAGVLCWPAVFRHCWGCGGARGDMGTGTDGISVTEDPVLRLFSAAGGGMAAAAPGGDLASEHGGVTTWDVP
ncbi:hypothetical protein CYMTET_54725 [Cymbomonas tetramitiformis]|uniref:Uncharacterized protein n=1 Tax=Cymbomonas tetramitiformis TaxID=36881 RepID=A0AAE0BFK3_9CHLO|nr:hypothetical protein CYMTET_54725 [Cymbomonas tetramitiformis]